MSNLTLYLLSQDQISLLKIQLRNLPVLLRRNLAAQRSKAALCAVTDFNVAKERTVVHLSEVNAWRSRKILVLQLVNLAAESLKAKLIAAMNLNAAKERNVVNLSSKEYARKSPPVLPRKNLVAKSSKGRLNVARVFNAAKERIIAKMFGGVNAFGKLSNTCCCVF